MSVVPSLFTSFLIVQGVDEVATLGAPLIGPIQAGGFTVEYFEKARLEDHSSETSDPLWKVQFGLLTQEMQQFCAGSLSTVCSGLAVGGDTSTISYATFVTASAASKRVAPPTGFGGGIAFMSDGSVFIPYTANLAAAPGHVVPPRVWAFMQRANRFPHGWLHDLGLPMTEPMTATVTKFGQPPRQITIQFFQRGIVTDDPLNPADWQLEIGNAGRDRLNLALNNGAPMAGGPQ